MSNVRQLSGMRECQIFGRQMFLPTDTAILQAEAGLVGGVNLLFGPGKTAVVGYMIGFHLKLTHANLPNRGVNFVPMGGHHFSTEIPFINGRWLTPTDRDAADRLVEQERRMLAVALPSLSERLFSDYLRGSISLLKLKRYFYRVREDILPAAPKPKHRRKRACTT